MARWDLRRATYVSPDGKVIIGSGFNPRGGAESWIVMLSSHPEIARKSANVNFQRHLTETLNPGWLTAVPIFRMTMFSPAGTFAGTRKFT